MVFFVAYFSIPIYYATTLLRVRQISPTGEENRQSDIEQYLSEPGHRLAGDDLISAQTGDEAQGLVLVLSAFQLAQDQGAENLHILQGTRDEAMKQGLKRRRVSSNCL